MKFRKVLFMAIASLLCFNIAFFILKNLQALAGWEERQPVVANEFIKQHIPSGSKVIGSPLYYYAVIKAGSDYQYYNYYNELEERERLHREVYDYDFLIVTKYFEERDYKQVIPYYFSKAELKLVAKLEIEQSEMANFISNFRLGDFRLLSNVEKYGYSCAIYQRIK